MRRLGRAQLVAVGLLILAGVGLAIVADAGADVTPQLLQVTKHLPRVLRVVVYVFVGVPIALGICFYVAFELADMIGFVLRPFAWAWRAASERWTRPRSSTVWAEVAPPEKESAARILHSIAQNEHYWKMSAVDRIQRWPSDGLGVKMK